MEERYKSLTAMKAEPWIKHFQKTAGCTSLWTSRPKAVVIKRGKTEGGSGHGNFPLTVVSPIEQSNEMAKAELTSKSDKSTSRDLGASVKHHPKSRTQRIKRKTPGESVTVNKKITRIGDIFTKHGKR